MHFLNGRQFTILILGIWWALLAYLTPAFPVETALDSFRVSESDNSSSFTPDRALLPRSNLVPQEWKIEKQYRRRLKTAPHDKEPTELIRETVRATREADPRHTKKIIYTVGQTQLVVYSTRVLGKDTYGTVYAGELGPEKKNVAVKETTSATVFRGAALLEKLQKSEYVIQQFEVFQGDSVLQNKQGYFPHGFFQVTQRTAGHLARWIETVGLDEWEKYHQLVVHDCLQGVVDLAAENIAHRDITPEKWYVRMSGAKPKVFLGGFTKAINQPYSSAVETGTFGYVSLEYMIGPHYSTLKGDVFAAAMSMLQVLFQPRLPAGAHWPVKELWRAILDAKMQNEIREVMLSEKFKDVLPGMTYKLADVFSKATCTPQKYRSTAQEFRDALLPLLPLEIDECGDGGV